MGDTAIVMLNWLMIYGAGRAFLDADPTALAVFGHPGMLVFLTAWKDAFHPTSSILPGSRISLDVLPLK
jgi:hypothetical protein